MGSDNQEQWTSQDSLRVLKKLFFGEREDIWNTVLYSAAVGLVTLVTPIGVQALVNTVALGIFLQPLFALVAIVFLGLLFVAWLGVLRAKVVEAIQRRLFVRTSEAMFDRLVGGDIQALEGHRGLFAALRFAEIPSIQKGAASLLFGGLEAVLIASIGMIALAFYHPILFAFDLLLVLGIVIITWLMGRQGPPTAIRESKRKYAVFEWLTLVGQHTEEVRSLEHAPNARNNLTHKVDDYLRARNDHFRVYLRQLASFLALQAIANASLLLFGGYLVIEQHWSLGQLVAAELLLNAVLGALAKFGQYIEVWYDLIASSEKVIHVLELPSSQQGEVELSAAELSALDVNVDAADLHLEPGQHYLLHFKSSRAALSERAAVQLARELGALLPSVEYGVRFQGFPSSQLKSESIRKRIAYIRNPGLMNDSIWETANPKAGLGGSALQLRDLLRELGGSHLIDDTHAPRTSSDVMTLSLAQALLREPALIVVEGGFAGYSRVQRNQWSEVLANPRFSHSFVMVCATEEEGMFSQALQTVDIDLAMQRKRARSLVGGS